MLQLPNAADSLAEQIALHIAEEIIRGELVEGERIQELRFANELDVSRGSVREALLLLQRTNLIEIYPYKGAVVSEMTVQQVIALFDVVGLILAQIVQRISVHGDEIIIEKFQMMLEQLTEYYHSGQTEKFFDLIFQSLLKYKDIVGNSYLMKYYQEILPSLRRSYFLVLNCSKRELQDSLELIKLVIMQIVSRNSQHAAINMENFCRHLHHLVVQSLERMKQIELAWARSSRR